MVGNSLVDQPDLGRTDGASRVEALECSRGLLMNIKDVVNIDPERMSGAPCFTGTRVPIGHLFEYLESGETLDGFLDQFPTVTREQALAALELSKESLLNQYEVAA
jgi:uncharacterized protein (DUF433 family)